MKPFIKYLSFTELKYRWKTEVNGSIITTIVKGGLPVYENDDPIVGPVELPPEEVKERYVFSGTGHCKNLNLNDLIFKQYDVLAFEGKYDVNPIQNFTTTTSEKRLNGWKEIAEHIGVHPDTARKLGLPVHKIGVTKQSGVYAYPSELNNFMDKKSKKIKR